MTRQYKFLDLSGYAWTGKHAVIDLMREFKGYHVPHFTFEFCLLRIQGGILDLKTALVDDWSPVRSDAAIRRFKKLVRRVGTKSSRLDPRTWFEAIGWNYDEYFNQKFFSLSNAYVDRLVACSWSAQWPYAMTEWSAGELFLRRILRKLGRKKAFFVTQHLCDPTDFMEATREYLGAVLSSNVSDDINTIVMHNCFEPFNPYRSLQILENSKCIVVDRDPRDNYVDQIRYMQKGGAAAVNLPVSMFIQRYRLYRTIARKYQVNSDRLLRIRFEDLVLKYDATLTMIISFLGEERSIHMRPKQYFDPAVSRKNVGIWKTHGNQAEIDTIHRELSEYCDEQVSQA
jgi:hypothetical protein